MPMWVCWENPSTGKPQRIYNYYDPDTDIGEKAIQIARRSLSDKFNIPKDAIPGFRVEQAPWLSPSEKDRQAYNDGGEEVVTR